VAEKSRFGAEILLEPSRIGGVRRSTLFSISRVAWVRQGFTMRAVAQRVRRDPPGDAGLIAIADNGPILAADLPADPEPSEEK
jgi:hypothetical protein